jgi:hypothetical protein
MGAVHGWGAGRWLAVELVIIDPESIPISVSPNPGLPHPQTLLHRFDAPRLTAHAAGCGCRAGAPRKSALWTLHEQLDPIDLTSYPPYFLVDHHPAVALHPSPPIPRCHPNEDRKTPFYNCRIVGLSMVCMVWPCRT